LHVHLSLGVDLGKALTDYQCSRRAKHQPRCKDSAEGEASQLGYVKEKIELFSLAKRVQKIRSNGFLWTSVDFCAEYANIISLIIYGSQPQTVTVQTL